MTDSTCPHNNRGVHKPSAVLAHELTACLGIAGDLPEMLVGKIFHVIGEFFDSALGQPACGFTYGKDIGDYRFVYAKSSGSLDLLLVNRRTDAVYFKRLSRLRS